MKPLAAKKRMVAVLRPLAERKPVYFGYPLYKLEKELTSAAVEEQDDEPEEDINQDLIKTETSQIRRRAFRKGKALSRPKG